MAKAKEHPSGIDRWTSNGYGFTCGPISEERRKAVAKINADLAKKKKTAKKK